MSTDSDAMTWEPDPDNDYCFFVGDKRFHVVAHADGQDYDREIRDAIIADHKATAAARECKHEVATQRFHFYQEGNPAMSWWCSNCGALFLHDEVKLPALDEVTR